MEVANRGSNLIYYVITWYLVGFMCDSVIGRYHVSQQQYSRHETGQREHIHGTQYHLLRAQTETVA